MSWEWSHTQEAYEHARENLEKLPHSELAIIHAEIQATRHDTRYTGFPQFNRNRYNKCLEYAKLFTCEQLIEYIWEYAEQYRTCTNGGHMAHVCPYGCHTVSFGGNDNE